jgi:hypothetical protein
MAHFSFIAFLYRATMAKWIYGSGNSVTNIDNNTNGINRPASTRNTPKYQLCHWTPAQTFVTNSFAQTLRMTDKYAISGMSTADTMMEVAIFSSENAPTKREIFIATNRITPSCSPSGFAFGGDSCDPKNARVYKGNMIGSMTMTAEAMIDIHGNDDMLVYSKSNG